MDTRRRMLLTYKITDKIWPRMLLTYKTTDKIWPRMLLTYKITDKIWPRMLLTYKTTDKIWPRMLLTYKTTDKIWPRMLLTYKITDDFATKTFLQRQKVVQILLFVYSSSSRNPHNVLMFAIFPQWKYLGRKAYPNRRHYICFLIILIVSTRSVF
jgi:hypothetical protein